MNVNDKNTETKEREIDRLTHGLMQQTLEQPSLSLNARIMARIMKEKRQVYRYYIRRLPSSRAILTAVAAYAAAMIGLFYFLFLHAGAEAAIGDSLKKYFPLLLTAIGCASLFFCFTQLDNWLLKKEKKNSAEPDLK